MTETVRLGTIAGVRVGLHWSVLGIVALLVVGLGWGLLPAQFPGEAAWAYITAAVVATVLFVLSLLAHEVGHAVVAVRNGIEVDGITLWLLGGVARLRGDSPNPSTDFRIAAVGPLISLVLGVVFGILGLVIEGVVPDLANGVVSYLAAINVLLALFNLIPAAPLDGGRILRSALWAWRGDKLQAQVWSARAGRVFGMLLAALGLILLFQTGTGLWWILIGLFIVTMASAEENHARTGAVLAGLRVRDIMTPDPYTADPNLNVDEFVRDVAMTRRHSAFPLLNADGDVQGLITLNRVRALPPDQREGTAISDVACPADEVPIMSPDDLASELLGEMGRCADGRALVMESGRLVGIVSPSDVSRAISLRGIGLQSYGGSDITRSDDH